MNKQRQFDLKAILVIIAVLSVPLAMIATRERSWMICGVGFLAVTVSICIGCVTRGWRGAPADLLIGSAILGVIVLAVIIALVFG